MQRIKSATYRIERRGIEIGKKSARHRPLGGSFRWKRSGVLLCDEAFLISWCVWIWRMDNLWKRVVQYFNITVGSREMVVQNCNDDDDWMGLAVTQSRDVVAIHAWVSKHSTTTTTTTRSLSLLLWMSLLVINDTNIISILDIGIILQHSQNNEWLRTAFFHFNFGDWHHHQQQHTITTTMTTTTTTMTTTTTTTKKHHWQQQQQQPTSLGLLPLFPAS